MPILIQKKLASVLDQDPGSMNSQRSHMPRFGVIYFWSDFPMSAAFTLLGSGDPAGDYLAQNWHEISSSSSSGVG